MAPRGWSCAQLAAADGSSALAVYPTGQPNPTTSPKPVAPGAQVVSAQFDYTGHVPGVDLVCPYFPSAASASEPCPSAVPAGEVVQHLTPDIVSITDPAKVKGSLAGSGGLHAVTAMVIVPQAPNVSSVDVAEESCSLTDTSLCPTILADFVVRQFPVPTHAPA